MAKFTNQQQVAFADKACREGWKYWYGTCGYKASQSLLTRKQQQYPSHYTSSRMSTYKKHITERRMVADCVGLIKAFFWSGNGTAEAKYAINNCPDKSANGMYALCKTKGAIATIPKTPGLVVWNNGHIGISLDGIWAIEARSFNFGVVKTRIKDRSWTNWGQLPASMLDYVTASAQESDEPKEPIPSNPIACPHQEPTGNLKIRSKGDGVKWVQWMLHACGYNIGKYGIDGDFGSATDSAVRAFQRNRKLVADGIVGVMTRRALLAAVEKR